jgi:hypothetical protein
MIWNKAVPHDWFPLSYNPGLYLGIFFSCVLLMLILTIRPEPGMKLVKIFFNINPNTGSRCQLQESGTLGRELILWEYKYQKDR